MTKQLHVRKVAVLIFCLFSHTICFQSQKCGIRCMHTHRSLYTIFKNVSKSKICLISKLNPKKFKHGRMAEKIDFSSWRKQKQSSPHCISVDINQLLDIGVISEHPVYGILHSDLASFHWLMFHDHIHITVINLQYKH